MGRLLVVFAMVAGCSNGPLAAENNEPCSWKSYLSDTEGSGMCQAQRYDSGRLRTVSTTLDGVEFIIDFSSLEREPVATDMITVTPSSGIVTAIGKNGSCSLGDPGQVVVYRDRSWSVSVAANCNLDGVVNQDLSINALISYLDQ